MRRKALISLLLLVLFTGTSIPQSIDHYHQLDFQSMPSGAGRFGLYGFDNPAILSLVEGPNLLFQYAQYEKNRNLKRYGAFAAVPNFGFGVLHTEHLNKSAQLYKASAAFGDERISAGISYGWSSGDGKAFNLYNQFSAGFLFRTTRHFSLSGIAVLPGKHHDNYAVLEAAIRPTGDEKVTIFGDVVISKNMSAYRDRWSVGAQLELLPGLRLNGRYFESKLFRLGAEVSFGHFGVSAQTHHDQNSQYSHTTVGLRIGTYDRTLFKGLSSQSFYKVALPGGLKYQRFQWFDSGVTLLDMIQNLKAAAEDNTVAGVYLDLSDAGGNRELLWELRQELLRFKAQGKKIVAYIRNTNIDVYQVATVADAIVMDPVCMLTLEGYLAGRTFFKGTLDKLGIGFSEWRFFTYKSALENFSRDAMSEADKEQRQLIIDEYHRTAKETICQARNISSQTFDSLVNGYVVFTPQEALKAGLIDAIGRIDTVQETIKKISGSEKPFSGSASLTSLQLPQDDMWGGYPKIAIIYALGATSMDDGIRARSLVNEIAKAGSDNTVKAIVFRVDSPGGDVLAADLVASELLKWKGRKPIIISQGAVAGSGGYMISMYGDTIVSAPITVTGSIGVIGGWYYNKGLKEYIGATTDHIKTAEHADMQFGMTMPLLGLSLPDRDLTDIEKVKMEQMIRWHYQEFITKVASARGMSIDGVDSVAQGRVWTGRDALNLGLVDVLGGLHTAIELAKERAGIGSKYEIVTYPAPALLDLNMFIPRVVSLREQLSESMQSLLFRMERNGIPLYMIPSELMDEELYP